MGSYNPPALHFAFQLGGLWLLLRKAIRREGLTLGSPLLFQVIFPQLSQKGTYLFTKGITQMAGSIQQQFENSVPGPRVPPRELQ